MQPIVLKIKYANKKSPKDGLLFHWWQRLTVTPKWNTDEEMHNDIFFLSQQWPLNHVDKLAQEKKNTAIKIWP